MKISIFLFLTVFFLINLSNAQTMGKTIADIDGNIYNTIKIGEQIWMVDFLRTTKYNDGTNIQQINDSSLWKNSASGAYCNFYNNTENLKNYGRLYNWFAVNESKGLCPKGWRVPTEDEWVILKSTLRSNTYLNEYKGWWSYEIYGQSLLPIDYRDRNGIFPNENSLLLTNYGGFWSSTSESETKAKFLTVGFSSYSMMMKSDHKTGGYCVLCIKN